MARRRGVQVPVKVERMASQEEEDEVPKSDDATSDIDDPDEDVLYLMRGEAEQKQSDGDLNKDGDQGVRDGAKVPVFQSHFRILDCQLIPSQTCPVHDFRELEAEIVEEA